VRKSIDYFAVLLFSKNACRTFPGQAELRPEFARRAVAFTAANQRL